MAQHIIQGPSQSDSAEIRFGAILGGRQYDMTLAWNDRMKYWRFEMVGANDERLLDGIGITANIDMLQPYTDARMPPGQLVCHDTENKREQPGRRDFINRHLLIYVDPVEEDEPPSTTVEIVTNPN